MKVEDIKHINWIYDRLIRVHKENSNYGYMLKFKEIIDKQVNYPEEFVHLSKGKYLHKDGSIKKAELMKDHLDNEYYMVAKENLYE